MTYLPLRRLDVPELPIDPPALSPREEAQAEKWGEELIVTQDVEQSLSLIIDVLPFLEDGLKYRRFLPVLEELRKELETDRQALELQWGDD